MGRGCCTQVPGPTEDSLLPPPPCHVFVLKPPSPSTVCECVWKTSNHAASGARSRVKRRVLLGRRLAESNERQPLQLKVPRLPNPNEQLTSPTHDTPPHQYSKIVREWEKFPPLTVGTFPSLAHAHLPSCAKVTFDGYWTHSVQFSCSVMSNSL